jgi:hypothetical protein
LAIADTLSKLGFNIQFLGGEEYVLNKLQILKGKVTPIREAFVQNYTPRFMRYFFTYKPYGKQKIFVEKLMKATWKGLHIQ